MHLIAHWLGLDDPGGSWYLAWSGILADIGELAIVGGLVTLVRRHNCEVRKCWRMGRHVTAAGHYVCRAHHPDGPLTALAVRNAHYRCLGKQPGHG